jgi:hypothetical protein
MLIVKMMSDQDNRADEDEGKRFRLLHGVVDVRFDHEGGEHVMHVWYAKDQDPDFLRPSSFMIAGTVYVMNETGRTISSFRPNAEPEPRGLEPE